MDDRSTRVLLAVIGLGAAASATACPGPGRERYEPRSFLGYACDDDCREHKAGYAWAVRHRITTAAACATLRKASSEGCRAFVEGGLDPEAEGYRWALENEVSCAQDCAGAGARFGRGCLRALPPPGAAYPWCAEALPDRGEAFPGVRPPR